MKWMLLAVVLGAALRVPGWFTQEEMKMWGLFETDEEQHVGITMERYNEWAEVPVPNPFPNRQFNVRGYGHLNAAVVGLWHGLTGQEVTFGSILRSGRVLATLFSLALVALLYFMALRLGLSPGSAGVASLLLATCDLHATYGHYALPLSGYLFAVYLSLYGGIGWLRRPSASAAACLGIGAAAAIAFKFDVLPAAVGGLMVVGDLIRRRGRVGLPYLALLGVGLLCFAAAFLLLTWGWSFEEMAGSFTELQGQNINVVPSDDHLRDNLVVYPLAVLAGIGLPAFLLSVAGVLWAIRSRWPLTAAYRYYPTAVIAYVGGLLLLEFGVLWTMDTAFVRRAAIFMPAVALLAAFALHRLRAGRGAVTAVVVYTLVFAVVGQSHHWFDTRYAFRDWANAELPAPARVGVAGIGVKGLDNVRYYGSIDYEYFAFHEQFSSRYTKSMTTPFGLPECCEGVYHCHSEAICRQVQEMLTGKSDDFVLVKAFKTWDVFPSRLLYHALFGYYETFLGDVYVYRRVRPAAPEG